jgi:hypothetical protein
VDRGISCAGAGCVEALSQKWRLRGFSDPEDSGTAIAHRLASTRFVEELTMHRFGNAATRHNTADRQDNDLHVRIRAEFSEMPGLKLTLPQASRLFNIEPALCAHALDRLVSAGCLSLAGGAFVRAGGGRQSA